MVGIARQQRAIKVADGDSVYWRPPSGAALLSVTTSAVLRGWPPPKAGGPGPKSELGGTLCLPPVVGRCGVVDFLCRLVSSLWPLSCYESSASLRLLPQLGLAAITKKRVHSHRCRPPPGLECGRQSEYVFSRFIHDQAARLTPARSCPSLRISHVCASAPATPAAETFVPSVSASRLRARFYLGALSRGPLRRAGEQDARLVAHISTLHSTVPRFCRSLAEAG